MCDLNASVLEFVIVKLNLFVLIHVFQQFSVFLYLF